MNMTPTDHHRVRSLMVTPERAEVLKQEAVELNSWDLTQRQVWDIELLLNGAFSPLAGFLGKADYESVCADMRLADGSLWPMPIMLDVTDEYSETLSEGDRIALRHPEGMILAILTVGDIWKADLEQEALSVFGTKDDAHPGVFQLLRQTNPVYVGGTLEGVDTSPHHTFHELRHSPEELRQKFADLGWDKIVAFQTRNPLHRAHVELTKRAVEDTGAKLLLHPVVGRTSPGDVDYFSRVRCYQAVIDHYSDQSATLSLLPLAMRMGGPREALWHALIRKNYGCTHLIIGRDHAGPRDGQGNPFYGPYDAQELAQKHQEEMGIEIVSFEEMVYVEGEDKYIARSQVAEGASVLNLSGTDLRQALRTGADIPAWFSYPEVIDELRQSYPPRSKQGVTVFFTGLSGSGKSTIANVLVAKLMEIGTRPVTLLDGDIVRKNLSSELGFSKEHRDLNVTRIGYVGSEITKNRGFAICAPIAPYESVRKSVRQEIEQYGGFVETYIATPIEVCEQRDRKGLYAKARAGIIKGFTGIDDPYEAPQNPELRIDTTKMTADEAAEQILSYLRQEGFLTE
jgi:sulfate adenylyltransferase